MLRSAVRCASSLKMATVRHTVAFTKAQLLTILLHLASSILLHRARGNDGLIQPKPHSSTGSQVLTAMHGAAAIATLNRPKALNALTLTMVKELQTFVQVRHCAIELLPCPSADGRVECW